jgi:hypothetical protein
LILLISALSVIGLILWFQVFARVRAELAPLTACTTIMAIIYAAALAGLLAPVTIVLNAAGMLFAAAGLWKLWANPPANRDAIAATLLIFVAAVAASWVWLSGQTYGTWDEFSHWGRISKAITTDAALPGPSSAVVLKDYPPATALLHYFILRSKFSEGGTYFAQAFILIASALALASWSGKSKSASYGLVILLGLSLFASLGLGFATVEVDHVLGGMFGATVAATAHRDSTIRDRFALVPILFCLPLIKTIGLVFALSAVAMVLAVDVLQPLIFGPSPDRARGTVRNALGVVGVLLLAVLAAQQSWRMRVRAFEFNETFSVSFDSTAFAALTTSSKRDATQERVVESFKRAFHSAPVGRNGNGVVTDAGVWRGLSDPFPPSTAAHWLPLLSVLSLVVYALLPFDERSPYRFVFPLLVAGSIGYLLLLLYVYMVGFSRHEGTHVISFGRYASPWFLAWALVIAAGLGRAAAGNWLQRVAGLVLLVVATTWAVRRAPHHDPGAGIFARSRAAIQKVIERVEGHIPPDARTYIVWQQTEGFQLNVTAYELSPRPTNSWCWTVGEKYHAGDIWTCPLTTTEFAARIDDYDYLLLMQADDQFWTRYQSLFANHGSEEERQSRLFRVSHDDGALRLRRVASAP